MISLILSEISSEGFLGTGLDSTYPFVTASSMTLIVYPILSAKYTGTVPFIVTICSSS